MYPFSNKASRPSIPKNELSCSVCSVRDVEKHPGISVVDRRLQEAIHCCGVCLKKTPGLCGDKIKAWLLNQSTKAVP